MIKALQSARRVKVEEEESSSKKIAVNDMETCFGFDVSRCLFFNHLGPF